MGASALVPLSLLAPVPFTSAAWRDVPRWLRQRFLVLLEGVSASGGFDVFVHETSVLPGLLFEFLEALVLLVVLFVRDVVVVVLVVLVILGLE